jgi:amidohydrolase family protein
LGQQLIERVAAARVRLHDQTAAVDNQTDGSTGSQVQHFENCWGNGKHYRTPDFPQIGRVQCLSPQLYQYITCSFLSESTTDGRRATVQGTPRRSGSDPLLAGLDRIGMGAPRQGTLHRMDFEYEDRFRDLMKLKPSEYWRRQCKATFQFDPISAKLIDEIGVETMMWGSDYPHTDGIWPESSKYIEEQFAGLSPEVVHKITCENAAKFYGLIN